MPAKLDLVSIVGKQFGRLKVLSAERRPTGVQSRTTIYVMCQCDCGAILERKHDAVAYGNTKSCGCLHTDTARLRRRTHGMRSTQVWHIWAQMLQRCNNPKNKGYYKYGARGITVAKEWETFENFYRDMGDKPVGMSLGRIDNDLGYCKSNCRWETATQQARNRRITVTLTYCGITKSLAEWAEDIGISDRLLRDRIYKLGWSLDKALTTPRLGHPWNKKAA